jgi:stearoyl-CoA desaturase (delta-9 desaturase)
MFSSSTTSVSRLQLVALLIVIFGFFLIDFTLVNLIITIVSFYVFNVIGISITLHRYYTHKSFEFKNKFLRYLCTFISIIICRGSPIGWVYVHRLHHAYSDTDKDPHSPEILGFKLFGLGHLQEKNFNKFIVKDLLTKEQLDINKYYVLIVILYVLLLAIFNLEIAYFAWALPVVLVQLSQNSFNYFGHMYGYRNFDTDDTSTNNVFMFPFILGDAWHNNHHKNPALLSNKVKPFEIDPAASIINVIKK